MKKILLIILTAGTLIAGSWSTNIPPTAITIDGIRIDFIGLSVTTNMTVSGAIFVTRMSGVYEVSRDKVIVSPSDTVAILDKCGVSVEQMASVMMGVSGITNRLIQRVEVSIDPRTGSAKIGIIPTLGHRVNVSETSVENAGLNLAVFRSAFLDFIKKHLN